MFLEFGRNWWLEQQSAHCISHSVCSLFKLLPVLDVVSMVWNVLPVNVLTAKIGIVGVDLWQCFGFWRLLIFVHVRSASNLSTNDLSLATGSTIYR